MLTVVSRRQQAILASISFGFDRDDELAGPFLDPINPRCSYASALLELGIETLLSSPDYVERLEAHYYQVKGATAVPSFRPRPMPAPRRRVDGAGRAAPVPRSLGGSGAEPSTARSPSAARLLAIASGSTIADGWVTRDMSKPVAVIACEDACACG
jgi:hypothetical protein